MIFQKLNMEGADAIIGDMNDLDRLGCLNMCRCSMTGVFEKADRIGQLFFQEIADSFCENSGWASLDILHEFRDLYFKLHPEDRELSLSNIFWKSCDHIRKEYNSKSASNNSNSSDEDLRQNGLISSLLMAAETINSEIDDESESNASDDSTGVTQEKKKKPTRSSKRETLLRRRRKRELDPVMKLAGLKDAPKGVYTTKTRTFRVQLNLRERKCKFSRNVDTLQDALWLYEIKVLASDKPANIDNLLLKSNFESFVQLGVLETKMEFYEKLGERITSLSEANMLPENEGPAAREAYNMLTL